MASSNDPQYRSIVAKEEEHATLSPPDQKPSRDSIAPAPTLNSTDKVANASQNDEATPSEGAGPSKDVPPPANLVNQSSNSENMASTASELPELEQVQTCTPIYSIFSKGQKRYIVFMVAMAGLFSPMSTNIYFPALPTLAADLNVSVQLINLTITTYMIFQGLAPTMFGDFADMAGRRPAFIVAFVVYLGANIGLALQDSYAALLVLRCLQSSGSSGTIALANGVVADIATSSERGTYLGFAMMGAMLGPAFAPVLGGILAEFLGWRSIFWFLTIAGGVYMVPLLISFPETGRNVVGNGSIPPQGWNMSLLNYLELRKSRADGLDRTVSREENRRMQSELASKRKLRFPNPLRTIYIILEKDVGVILFFNSIIYTGYYTITASLPTIFQEIYGFNNLQLGLCYLPFGAGCGVATILAGRVMDHNYKRVARKNNFTIDRRRGDDLRNFPIEKARIQVIWPLLWIGCAATLCYGWVLWKETNLAVPLILQFIVGVAWTAVFNVMSVLLVDLYPSSPATATAANNLVRCLLGAGGTAVINPMLTAMGRGWCFTFVAFVCVALSPLLWVEIRFGPRWREDRRVRELKHAEAKTEKHRVAAEAAEADRDTKKPEEVSKEKGEGGTEKSG
ncbi:MAG: hypothetical protein M4579_001787 [Chaenotheca gracillima]|nr:MAG: hypothetical protein M4579_001787 [Chaenotheca gracillima]